MIDIPEGTEVPMVDLDDSLAEAPADTPESLVSEDSVRISLDPAEAEAAAQEGEAEDSDGGEEAASELPEKYRDKSPEELVRMHQEAERKIGELAAKTKGLEIPAAEIGEDTTLDSLLETYADAWSPDAGLAEQAYKDIETKYGVSRRLVDQFIQGQEALARVAAQQITALAGGDAEYAAMTAWARENADEGTITAFNEAVKGNQPAVREAMVKMLHGQFKAATRKAKTVQGRTTPASVQGFKSEAEMVAAVNDPRYATDPAYRATVEKRIDLAQW